MTNFKILFNYRSEKQYVSIQYFLTVVWALSQTLTLNLYCQDNAGFTLLEELYNATCFEFRDNLIGVVSITFTALLRNCYKRFEMLNSLLRYTILFCRVIKKRKTIH